MNELAQISLMMLLTIAIAARPQITLTIPVKFYPLTDRMSFRVIGFFWGTNPGGEHNQPSLTKAPEIDGRRVLLCTGVSMVHHAPP